MKEFKIAIIGQIARWKGQDVFIKAAKLLHSTYPNMQFFLIGEVLFEKKEELLYKKELIDLANGCEYIKFFGHKEDILELLQEIDILVHASIREEPFGRVIIEGMASKTPVIAPGIGGPKEIIEDGVSGLLYEPGNELELSKTIETIVLDPLLYKKIADNGYNRFMKMFEIHNTVLEVECILMEMMKAKREEKYEYRRGNSN